MQVANNNNKPGAVAKPPIANSDRQAAWYEAHKDEFKQRNVKLPKELNKRLDAVLHAQGETFQGWVREQAELKTKGIE